MSLADLVGAVSETLACLAELAAKVEAEPRCDVPVCPVTVARSPSHPGVGAGGLCGVLCRHRLQSRVRRCYSGMARSHAGGGAMKSKPRCVVCEAKKQESPAPCPRRSVVCAECFGRAEGGTCIGCLGCVHTLVYGPKEHGAGDRHQRTTGTSARGRASEPGLFPANELEQRVTRCRRQGHQTWRG